MAVKKKMSTGKKVAIGSAFVVAVGAVLCYFFCPCFKKEEEMLPEENYDFGTASTEELGGGAPAPGGGWGPAPAPKLPRVPKAVGIEQLKSQLVAQKNGSGLTAQGETVII